MLTFLTMSPTFCFFVTIIIYRLALQASLDESYVSSISNNKPLSSKAHFTSVSHYSSAAGNQNNFTRAFRYSNIRFATCQKFIQLQLYKTAGQLQYRTPHYSHTHRISSRLPLQTVSSASNSHQINVASVSKPLHVVPAFACQVLPDLDHNCRGAYPRMSLVFVSFEQVVHSDLELASRKSIVSNVTLARLATFPAMRNQP